MPLGHEADLDINVTGTERDVQAPISAVLLLHPAALAGVQGADWQRAVHHRSLSQDLQL